MQLPLTTIHDTETSLAAIAHGPLGQQHHKRKARYQWSEQLREHRRNSPKKSPNLVESAPQQP